MRGRLTVAALALLAASACSGPGPAPASSPSPAASSAPGSTPTPVIKTSTPTPVPTESELRGTLPVAECLRHRYRLTGFTALDPSADYRKGRGGDIDIAFQGGLIDDGAYVGTHFTLSSRGRTPMIVTLADDTAELRVDGSVRGTYTLQSSEAIFTQDTYAGSASLRVSDQRRKLGLRRAAAAVAPVGASVVTCTKQLMTLTNSSFRLDLDRR